MKFSRQVFLFSFLFLLFFSGTKSAFGKIIFNQTPIDETYSGTILNTPQFVSFGCTAGLNCKISGKTVYDVGVWIKKVGSPADIRLQVANTWNDPTGGTADFSDSVSANTISETEYTLTWFHFPSGIVIGNQYDYNQFFQFQFTEVNGTYNTTDYYRVLYNTVNDYSAPQQWCKTGYGCSSSTFFWKMDNGVKPVPIPPELIGDPDNLPARISPTGDIPRIYLNCTNGHNYTLSLVHRDGDNVSYNYGVVQRKYCDEDGAISFDGFNINNLLTTRVDPEWWRWVHTPLEYIIKDTTGLYFAECDFDFCTLINLIGDFNGYNQNVYLASSTYWTTVGKGPIFETNDHTTWFNLGPETGVQPPACAANCFSNVLFLPGLMGSRLYKQDGSADKELWVSLNDSLQADLSLDLNGKSVNNVYTKNDTQNNGELDETGIVDDVFSFNIYQSFITDLKNWKQEGTIADYVFIPYDWRLSLDDVTTNGTTTNNNLSYAAPQNFSESFILKKLEALQSNSKSGKVTIIAHSNGGLVAKALIQKLKDTDNPLYDKIDKIIFVAVPQVGTPDAIAALLHGSELGPAGLVMERNRSRQLSENMPSIYNFLPSAGYFSTVDPVFAVDKLVSFENKPFFDSQTSQYGIYVSNETELKNYVLGTDGRIKPSFSDTVHPNIGNSNLYNQAESAHQMLDSWSPHPDTKVIQIAGWGEETLAGIDYKTYRDKDLIETLSYKPRFVVDGDGTVVVPSALWMPTGPNVERWWVDLAEEGGIVINRVHKDLFEIPNLLDFIKFQITDSIFSDPDTILVNDTATLVSDKPRLHYTLHSPLTIGIVDAQGRYTGQDPITKKIREEIPNVTYRQIGEVQFISAPADIAYTVKMQGYEEGSFSLDLDKQEGNNITSSTSFQGIPSSLSTIATIDVAPNMEVATSILKIDNNGDGTIDKTLNATPGGVTVYDVTPPELQITFDINTKDVILSAQDNIDQHPTLTISKDFITLQDNAGNTTVIPFIRLKELPTRLRLTYNKITRNGVTINVPKTNIVYDWQEKKGILTDLDTRVVIKGEEKYIFNYKKAKNVTTIKEKIGKNRQTKTVNGFVVVTVKTERDGLVVDY
ncbi:MAG: hypothetical protein HY507_00620 [Candidatus Zambryskibacteria bacterium]|nr:hypothetical protein [Candidatus Zambryskibacteria bacterium]